ncbi:MAG: HEPN domain-containing protein [Planctomycetaceae bacterium]|jgi:HEPN domain-containing protein|nr:HEPN domain-containing protein [Planctomycetaceae bacterium]
MKKQVEDWILLADKDLYTAELVIKDNFPLNNIVAFHCQQTIEKYLKAYLIEQNIPLIKTHDLVKLNGLIKEKKDIGIDENKLVLINEIYTESRYPGEFGLLPDGMPTDEQAKEFIKYAKEVKEIINNELKNG